MKIKILRGLPFLIVLLCAHAARAEVTEFEALRITSLATSTIVFGDLDIGKNLRVSGKVGIATSTPLYPLDVNGAVGMTHLRLPAQTGSIYFGATRFLHNFGLNNLFLGENAGNRSLTGSNNVGFGAYSLNSTTLGTNNTAIGSGAGARITTGTANTLIGKNAGYNCIFCTNSVAIGLNSMYGIQGSATASHETDANDVAIGLNSMGATTGYPQHAVAIGYYSQYMVGDTKYNTSVGYQSMADSLPGSSNTAIGAKSLRYGTNENQNTAVGFVSLFSSQGDNNTCIGAYCLTSNTTGRQNVALGAYAGETTAAGLANITGNFNTFVGYNAGPGTSTPISNAGAIGHMARVSKSNSFVIGAAGTGGVSVGIGTEEPSAKLDVIGSIKVGSPTQPKGITLFDTATQQPYCVVVTNGALALSPGKCY